MPIVTLRPNSDQYNPYAGTNIVVPLNQGTLAGALSDSSDLSYAALNRNATGAQPPPAGVILGSGALFIVGMTTAALPANSVIRSVTVRARAAKDPNAAFQYSIPPDLEVSFADNSRVAEGYPFPSQSDYAGAAVQPPLFASVGNTAIVTFVGDARSASPNNLGPVQNQPGPGGYYSGGAWTQADIDNLNLSVAYNGHNTDTVPPYVNPAPIFVYELYADVLYATVPSVLVTAPSGTITTENNPVIAWAYTAGQDGGPQVYYRVKIFSQAQYQAAGFDGWISTAVWDSGIVNSAVNSVRSGALLANGTYRAFVYVAAVTNGQTQWAASATTGPYSEFVINVPGPGAPTISASASSIAGRVAVNVTKGANPLWAYAQVQRSDDGGSTWVDIRDYTLHDMTGITTFTTFDYEAPPDTLVRYRARGLSLSGGGTAIGTWSANSNAVSWTIPYSVLTCDGAVAWLKNPLNANQNMLVRLGPGALLTKTRKINRGVFTVLGRARPVAVTDVRSSIETELKILTQTALEEAQLLALFDSAQTLLLQAPTVYGWASAYISPGDLSEAQVIPNITRPERMFTVPITVTDSPVGLSVPVVAAPPPPPINPPLNVSALATTALGVGTANNPSATTSSTSSAPPAFRGYASGTAATSASINVTLPAGAAAGDLCVVACMGTTGNTATPTGFTLISSAASDTIEVRTAYKYLVAGDITNGYVTMPGDPGFGGTRYCVWVLYSTGVTPTLDATVVYQASDLTTPTTVANVQSVTTTVASDIVLAAVGLRGGSAGTAFSSPPGGITVDQNSPTGFIAAYAYHYTQVVAGATPAQTVTYDEAYAREVTATISIKGGGAGSGGGGAAYPTLATTGVGSASLTTINMTGSIWRTSTDGAAFFTTQVIGGNTYRVFTNLHFVATTQAVYVDDPYVRFDHCQFDISGEVYNTSAQIQTASGVLALILDDCSTNGGTTFDNRGVQSTHGHLTVNRCQMLNYSDAAVEKSGDGLTDMIVNDSYFAQAKGWAAAAHADAIQTDGPIRDITIHHNTIWEEPYRATDGDSSAGNAATSCINLSTTLGTVRNIVIDHNQMAGGGYCIYITSNGGSAFVGTVSVDSNRFDRTHFPSLGGHACIWTPNGVLYPTAPHPGLSAGWTNNVWENGAALSYATAIS